MPYVFCTDNTNATFLINSFSTYGLFQDNGVPNNNGDFLGDMAIFCLHQKTQKLERMLQPIFI